MLVFVHADERRLGEGLLESVGSVHVPKAPKRFCSVAGTGAEKSGERGETGKSGFLVGVRTDLKQRREERGHGAALHSFLAIGSDAVLDEDRHLQVFERDLRALVLGLAKRFAAVDGKFGGAG